MRNIVAIVVAMLFLSGAVLAQAKTETAKETKAAPTEMKSAEKAAEVPAVHKHHHAKAKATGETTKKMATKSVKSAKASEKPAAEPK